MGIKLGDISPLAGAVTGKGLFGKGLAKLADSGAGFLIPASYLAKSQRDKAARKAARPAAGMGVRPMAEEVMVAEEAPAMKKGGRVKKSDIKQDKAMIASAVHKHERAKHKGQPLTKMAKGGSTASKRGDGCATKGKTKGRFV